MRDSTGNLSLRLLQADGKTMLAHEMRTIAAIIHGTSDQATPNILTVCLHYWIDATELAVNVGTGEVLLRVLDRVLRFILSSNLRYTMSEEKVFALVKHIDEPGRPWKKLDLVAKALASATGHNTQPNIEQILQRCVEQERRWFEVR